MSDNALDSLHNGLRTAKKAVDEATKNKSQLTASKDREVDVLEKEWDARIADASLLMDKAARRYRILHTAHDIHVYEETPVVQAKLLAHERIAALEEEERQKRQSRASNLFFGSGSGLFVDAQWDDVPSRWVRFLRWAYIQLGGV